MNAKQLLIALDSRYPALPEPGVIDCEALATEYAVSPQTIRRALRALREARAQQSLRSAA